jgi:hypothetical protein
MTQSPPLRKVRALLMGQTTKREAGGGVMGANRTMWLNRRSY